MIRSYNITADELHARVIDDLRSFAKGTLSPEQMARAFATEQCRPLEQTIRMVCLMFRYPKKEGL
jgi:hypothetical protein